MRDTLFGIRIAIHGKAEVRALRTGIHPVPAFTREAELILRACIAVITRRSIRHRGMNAQARLRLADVSGARIAIVGT